MSEEEYYNSLEELYYQELLTLTNKSCQKKKLN